MHLSPYLLVVLMSPGGRRCRVGLVRVQGRARAGSERAVVGAERRERALGRAVAAADVPRRVDEDHVARPTRPSMGSDDPGDLGLELLVRQTFVRIGVAAAA